MLLSISTNRPNASELGFLLHKHPDRVQTFELSFGKCHVFYPESSETKCTMAMLLDIDSVAMARNKGNKKQNFALAGYVNDRPFVASSFMSTAISKVLGSAMSGQCKSHPKLAEEAIPLEVTINVLPVRGGESFLRSMFEPLGYTVSTDRLPLDEQFPQWGDSHYFSVRLETTTTVASVLSHLYVLIPVFDNQKHYFVSKDELDKLLDKGKGWLDSHPEMETIVRRYLKFMPSVARQAIAQLSEATESDDDSESKVDAEVAFEKKIRLHDARLDTVTEQLVNTGATRVIDLGCGEGKLLKRLIKNWQFKEIVGVDVSVRTLEIASKRLRLDELPSFQSERVKLMHGSLLYRDSRFGEFDAAALVEVIEHLDPPRLSAMERVVFRHALPKVVIVTTPNADYNAMWPDLPAGKFRHADHRFEWTRAEFKGWVDSICERFGYTAEIAPVGPLDEKLGAPTQMATFTKEGKPAAKGESQ
jgi:3' terminal RNA ribose 2'-O-methyltransferase Hen1